MSITKGFFHLLVYIRKKGFIQGDSILQLGRQSAFLNFEEAVEYLKAAGFDIPQINPELGFDPECKKRNCISDKTLFNLLGFKTVHSLDVSNYEDATLIHDLNAPNIEQPYQQYDVIYDGGTLEHVFSTLHALRNIHSFLKVGGTVVHVNPAQNHLDHGFYSFSPQMYHDYYLTNSYEILDSYMLESFKDGYNSFNAYQYKPGKLELLQFGGYGKEMLCNWFMARKLNVSTSGKIPHQGCSRIEYPPHPSIPETPTFLSQIKSSLRKNRSIRNAVKYGKKIAAKLFSYGQTLKRKVQPPRGVRKKLEFIGKF